MAKIIKLILFFYISILFIAYVESCCCSIWFLFTWCNCNPVGCQCTGTRCSYRPWNGGPGATEPCRQSDENPCARKSKVFEFFKKLRTHASNLKLFNLTIGNMDFLFFSPNSHLRKMIMHWICIKLWIRIWTDSSLWKKWRNQRNF